MTNPAPHHPGPQTPAPQKARRPAPGLFNAQNATGTLLLLTGSLALGLTTYWLGTGPATTATQTAQTSGPSGAGDVFVSNTMTSDDDDTEWDDDGGWNTAPAQPTYRAQPGFSQQPTGAPRGWTRGS